ncbi:KRAB-A domain-containing protein 2 [Trichinella sp. T6]|nr:KRAB-A domain-containing protein 2 [Trichinella sp. T6]
MPNVSSLICQHYEVHKEVAKQLSLKAVFEEKLRALIKEKGHNGTIFPTSQRDQIITDILRIQSDGPKSARDYNLKNRYGVLKSGEENKLIRLGKNEAIRCIASIEEMFDVINDAHQKIGHGGEKKTFREAQNKWANVTQEACHLFLTFGEECHKKRARKLPKSLFVKPLVSTNLMSRAQKFCILSPLMLKRAEEVASKLLEIFLTFGAPSILQSDNGREFSYVIIAELKTCWPELKLVTVKLTIWMLENGCKRWSMGLKFVQWQINVSIHETTGQSPFKVKFGEETRIGLESYVLPKSLNAAAKAEEKIEEFLTSQEANDEESSNRDGKTVKKMKATFIKARKEAALGQSRAAAKMTRRAKKKLIPLQIGQNCTLRVPDVDREPADPKNFLAVVMAECEGLYTVGCREKKLSSKFTAADLQILSDGPKSDSDYNLKNQYGV